MYVPTVHREGKILLLTNEIKVALIYNTSKAAETTAAEIASANNVKTAAYRANVGDQKEIDDVIQRIANDLGKLDIVVVNSGVTSNVPAEEYTTDQWSHIMRINLDGAFYTAQAAAKIFKKQGRGNVIFTASVSATLVNVPQKQAAVSIVLSFCLHSVDGCSIMPPKPVWCRWQSVLLSNGSISAV